MEPLPIEFLYEGERLYLYMAAGEPKCRLGVLGGNRNRMRDLR
jgi:hypothetical protein